VTLETLIAQVTPDCEIVVLDGGSTDDTEGTVSALVSRFQGLRYINQGAAHGCERDYSKAIESASGRYCWTVPDDDVVNPGAVATVLKFLDSDYSLILSNFEVMDASEAQGERYRIYEMATDKTFCSNDMESLYWNAGILATYLGSIIIERQLWLSRNKEPYYGSLHAHTGVIFQAKLPGPSLVLANPIIAHRVSGSHSWSARASEMIFKWPELVDSLAISEKAQGDFRKMLSPTSWIPALLLRALRYMSAREYRRWCRSRSCTPMERLVATVASITPPAVAFLACMLYYGGKPKGPRATTLFRLRNSPYHSRNWPLFNRRSRDSHGADVAHPNI
jgi:glycosyltransferase involved in cell wall biosynthesis